jgi:type II secretory pathway pseudopilin PulG
LKKIVLLVAAVAALLVPVAAEAATATISTSATGSQIQLFYVGTDAARITYSPGVALAPAVRHCVRNRCSTTFPITGNSYNCSSSSYFFSGSTPLTTDPLDFQTLNRSAVACQFSLVIRTVGAGTVTVTTLGVATVYDLLG